MNAGQFAKRRALIECDHGRRRGYARRAMAALVRESGATLVIVRGKPVAWRLPNGQMVCRKRRYNNEQHAVAALHNIRLEPRTARIPWRQYQCQHCHGWHLTSQAMAQDDQQWR